MCEVFGSSGYIGTAYTYTPYGQVSATGNVDQPIQWSSEFNDSELGLVYYNYRYYNPRLGKWIGRDYISYPFNLYIYCNNFPNIDYLGLSAIVYYTEKSLYEDLDKVIKKNTKKRLSIEKSVNDDIKIMDEKSKDYRKGMELFDWLRRQHVSIKYGDEDFMGASSDFIAKIKRNTYHLNYLFLLNSENIDAFKQRLKSISSMYDEVIIIGHSTPAQGGFVSELVLHKEDGSVIQFSREYFYKKYTLITCYTDDEKARIWEHKDAFYKNSVLNNFPDSIVCDSDSNKKILYMPFRIFSEHYASILEKGIDHYPDDVSENLTNDYSDSGLIIFSPVMD